MGRVSQPIQLTKEEREQLNDMLEHADERLRQRILIILACADEPSNKKVAALLDTDEHRVAKWKEAFRGRGIEGLTTSSGSGRKPKTTVPNLEDSVIHLLDDDNREWTVHSIACELGTTDYQVSKVLQSRGITLNRAREWTYETIDSVSSSDIELIGLYVSKKACAALGCYHPSGIRTSPGVFVTTNRGLAKKLENADGRLSVGDVLAEVRYHQCSKNAVTMFRSVINDWIDSLVLSFTDAPVESIEYHVFVWTQEKLNLKKILPAQIKLIACDSSESFLRSLHGWAGSLTTAAHLYDIELLMDSIKEYLRKDGPDQEHFLWRKSVIGVGTEENPIPYIPWKEVKPQAGFDEWVQQLLKGELGDSEIQSGLIAFARTSEGLSYRVIEGDSSMPGADQFSFDSEAGFLRGMNQLELAVLKMRDKAGIAAADLYIEEVKKNKSRSESRDGS